MEALQITWFFLVFILLTGYAILDGFDLGVGIWHCVTKNKSHRDKFIRAIGPFWDGNEVWLLTGGGAIFAAFPPVYATTFSGFYFAMMLVVFSLIFRAVSIEFRNKITSKRWIKFWDISFSLGSALPSLLFGVAVGNIMQGIPMDGNGNYIGTFFNLLNPYALLIGLTSFFMFATHGATFLNLKMSGDLQGIAKKWIKKSWVIYCLIYFVSLIFTMYKIHHNGMLTPIVVSCVGALTVGLIGVALANWKELTVFIISSISILINMVIVGSYIFPFLVPSSSEFNSGLTIYNSSSSELTLKVMLIMAIIGMPIVLFYTGYIYKTFAGKIEE